MHICVSVKSWKQVNIGAGEGLAPIWHHAITWTNDGVFSIWLLAMNLCVSQLYENTAVFFIYFNMQMIISRRDFNSLAPGRCGGNFDIVISEIYATD